MSDYNNLFLILSGENTATSAQITQKTKDSFDGPLYPIKLPPGETGPFYQVSANPFSCKEKFQACARYSRVRKLKHKLSKKSTNRHDFEIFLVANQKDIEMDAEFKLTEKIKRFFNCEQYSEVEETFKKTSKSRWLGLTKPKSFDEANEHYCLKHLKGKSTLYLYEIYFNVPVDIPNLEPILFCGKVKGGTSLQFKMNNHAVECVSKVEKVDTWNQ